MHFVVHIYFVLNIPNTYLSLRGKFLFIQLVRLLLFIIWHGYDSQDKVDQIERAQQNDQDEIYTVVQTLWAQHLEEI